MGCLVVQIYTVNLNAHGSATAAMYFPYITELGIRSNLAGNAGGNPLWARARRNAPANETVVATPRLKLEQSATHLQLFHLG